MADQPNDNMIAALLRERAAYTRAGNTERAAQVDEQLKHYGYEGDADKDAPDHLDGKVPQGRNASGEQQTAEGESGKDKSATSAASKRAATKATGGS